jgi:hypothetical protein
MDLFTQKLKEKAAKAKAKDKPKKGKKGKKAKGKPNAVASPLEAKVRDMLALRAERDEIQNRLQDMEAGVREALEAERLKECHRAQSWVKSASCGLVSVSGATRCGWFDVHQIDDDDGSTLWEQAAEVVGAALGIDYDEASATLERVLEVEKGATVAPGALNDPAVVEVLTEQLPEGTVSPFARAKLSADTIYRASWDPGYKLIVEALLAHGGLFTVSSPSLRVKNK